MALRLITGRSGQGKTEYLVQEVIRLSMENSQQKYYVIVPEQFSLEMQRKIVRNIQVFAGVTVRMNPFNLSNSN
ncbi:MAG: hypothetical protein ACLTEE_11925, partial [Anaerobutyricum hallii]